MALLVTVLLDKVMTALLDTSGFTTEAAVAAKARLEVQAVTTTPVTEVTGRLGMEPPMLEAVQAVLGAAPMVMEVLAEALTLKSYGTAQQAVNTQPLTQAVVVEAVAIIIVVVMAAQAL
jgi:hypothetical protein